MEHAAPSVDRLAFSATLHCLTGCAIGEVLGLVIATRLGWHDAASIALAVVLSFAFGYVLTLQPLLASGTATLSGVRLASLADRQTRRNAARYRPTHGAGALGRSDQLDTPVGTLSPGGAVRCDKHPTHLA